MQTFGPGVPVLQEYIEQHLNEHIEGYQSGRRFPWSLILRENGEKIGFGYLRWEDDQFYTLSIGYLIRKEYWGNGYATEFAKAAVKFGIGELNPYQIVATVIPDHIASRRVLEKSGFYTAITFPNGIGISTPLRILPVRMNRLHSKAPAGRYVYSISPIILC
jgi:RimJ/RimL family protein N-acetyltransferase